jgi:hypothetical protein
MSAPNMRNNDRATDDQTDGKTVENLGASDVDSAGFAGAGVEREEPIDDGVPFIETLDSQTRAELDEVLERSTMLARSVIAALYRR